MATPNHPKTNPPYKYSPAKDGTSPATGGIQNACGFCKGRSPCKKGCGELSEGGESDGVWGCFTGKGFQGFALAVFAPLFPVKKWKRYFEKKKYFLKRAGG